MLLRHLDEVVDRGVGGGVCVVGQQVACRLLTSKAARSTDTLDEFLSDGTQEQSND